MENMIHVKLISGIIDAIPEKDFDPVKHQRLDPVEETPKKKGK